MDTLLNRFSDKVNSIITGFDRIVFKGMARPIMHSEGMESFLKSRKVKNKDFKDYAVAQSKLIVESAEKLAEEQCGAEVTYIPSLNTRKEELAHKRQEELGKKEGLIGVWSCVESCSTFRSKFDPAKTYPSLSFERSKCKHLYFYFDDPVYGFMSARLQTWAPYEVQIALNGREWLRRSLDAAGCGYTVAGNKFSHIDDYELAQKLLYDQVGTDFDSVLDGFLPSFFTEMPAVMGNHLAYYWTCWQSEVAKDYIFKDCGALGALMDDFQLHALITGKGGRIMKYFGAPVRKDGQPYRNTNPEVASRTENWYDGMRVRHWCMGNSVKFYNEHNVLRFETTLNIPSRFKVFRNTEGQCDEEPLKFKPMRKGVVDMLPRFCVSREIADRFTEHMSMVKEKSRLGDLLDSVGSPIESDGKRVRAIDVFGKDKAFLQAISDPAMDIHGITNKQLQKILEGTPWAKGMAGKRLSGRITRHLALLRKHGLIEQSPGQRKYFLTVMGCRMTTALDVSLATSVDALLSQAA